MAWALAVGAKENHSSGGPSEDVYLVGMTTYPGALISCMQIKALPESTKSISVPAKPVASVKRSNLPFKSKEITSTTQARAIYIDIHLLTAKRNCSRS